MNHPAGQHLSVLLDASVQALQLKPAGTYVDATFGRGGHTRAMLERLGRAARVVAFDKDPQAIEAAHAIVDARFSIVHAGFVDLAPELAARGIDAVDGVLFDLGVSSPQLDDPTRGFSFRQDGPLDMRMDTTRGMSAAEFVATATQGELARVIRDYGEERFAVSVAKAIVARRSTEPITRTGDLAALVARAVRTREPNQDPATRTFQALRIHINRELEELPLALESALRLLVPGGRLAVIAFHSLEDRIVKRFMHARSRVPEALARLPLRESQLPAPLLTEIERVLPDAAEIARNPRARSAVLRSATRTAAAYRATEAT